MIETETVEAPMVVNLHREWTINEQTEFQNMVDEYSACNLGKIDANQALDVSMKLMMVFDEALRLRYQVQKFDA